MSDLQFIVLLATLILIASALERGDTFLKEMTWVASLTLYTLAFIRWMAV